MTTFIAAAPSDPNAGPVEEILEPELEITDPHHHLWTNIFPTYQLDELLADTESGHRVTRTVFLECAQWSLDDAPADAPELAPVAEVARIAEIAAQSRERGSTVIGAIVGYADLRYGDRIGAVLDQSIEAGRGWFSGIRCCTPWDDSPLVEHAFHPARPEPRQLERPVVRQGLRQVADRGLTFDAWVFHPQLPEVLSVAQAFPELTIVVNHTGGPLAVGPYAGRVDEVTADWRRNLADLARCENVRLKIGGIGMRKIGLHPADGSGPPTSAELAQLWGDRVRWCIETFGADRCMFESNFPVDGASVSYVVLWNAFKRMAAEASPSEKADLFRGTAESVYGRSQ